MVVLKSREFGDIKGIVHFEIIFWYVLSYLKGIQDVGVFFFTVVSSQTVSVSVI